MLYALLDPRDGGLVLANAGHNYPLLVNGSVNELELSGLPLGVDGDSDYGELRARLAPGDSVVLYTDGVTEATNPQGEMFGDERLHALVYANSRLKPRAMVSLLLHELRAWGAGSPQSDDVTMVVLRRRLAAVSDELRLSADEVLGAERAAQLWQELPDTLNMPVERWAALLPDLVRRTQEHFGRGLARELQQQLRLLLDEYRGEH
jgi:sigma-B regulation protein RsbU (phosphoserine phosphatase)